MCNPGIAVSLTFHQTTGSPIASVPSSCSIVSQPPLAQMSHRFHLGLEFVYAVAIHCKNLGPLTDSDPTVGMEGLAVLEAFTYAITPYNIKEFLHNWWELILSRHH